MVLAACVLTADAEVRRALVFGLGKYEDTSWATIHGDADVFYVIQMLSQCGFTDIRTLSNEQATKQGMVNAFIDLANSCRKGDVVYVHYSGHGQLMTDLDGDEALRTTANHGQWDESWIPYDAYMTYCDKDRGEKHLCDDEVSFYLGTIRDRIGRKGKLMVSVDACHSGDATRKGVVAGNSGDAEECVRGVDVKFNIPKDLGNASVMNVRDEDWMTVSACKPYQLCTEMTNLNIGKLTYALYSIGADVMTMSGPDLQEKLTWYIEKNKSRLPQEPQVTGNR